MVSRIEEIIRKNGLTAKQFADILGVGNSKITDWRNGKTKPTLNDIIGISQKFKVTSDYLIFGKDSSSDLTENEANLIAAFRRCSPELQLEISTYVYGLLKGYEIASHQQNGSASVPQQYDIQMAAFGSDTASQHVNMTPEEYKEWIEDLRKDAK